MAVSIRNVTITSPSTYTLVGRAATMTPWDFRSSAQFWCLLKHRAPPAEPPRSPRKRGEAPGEVVASAHPYEDRNYPPSCLRHIGSAFPSRLALTPVNIILD
jgi:hypothetical protein